MTVLDKKPMFLSLQKSKIKFYLLLFFSTSLFFRGLFAFNSFEQNEKYVEGIAAIVGEKIILKSDVSQIISMTALQQNIGPLKNPKLFSGLQSQVLQSLIDQKIIIEMAEFDSLVINEKDVDTALDQQIKAFIEQAIEYSKSYGGIFIGAHHCTIGSGTSADAKRVWKSLSPEYASSGDVIFIGL